MKNASKGAAKQVKKAKLDQTPSAAILVSHILHVVPNF